MTRLTKHDYQEPGSWERILEGVYALWEVDTDSKSDGDYIRAMARFRKSIRDRERQVFQRLTRWQSKGGKARWHGTTPEQRREEMRRIRRGATCKHVEVDQAVR